ncbi:hypothetical protein BJY01DRAFT_242465 [Aspergillus pseudoustus]|uniref:Emp24/gp25L/p24 family/GOLD-domain-containing protein n=1 Tax=Aspergillus pseudoustus TaxID=1810923 RepID=A0ABR4KXS7_9EURO
MSITRNMRFLAFSTIRPPRLASSLTKLLHEFCLISLALCVLFQCDGFALTYESGFDNVHRFDAHIEVYGGDKVVKVQFDSPYIKGLPTTIHIKQTVDGEYHETMRRITYEDSYTQEFCELWELVVSGRSVKTTISDAEEDLKIFQMIMQAGC